MITQIFINEIKKHALLNSNTNLNKKINFNLTLNLNQKGKTHRILRQHQENV